MSSNAQRAYELRLTGLEWVEVAKQAGYSHKQSAFSAAEQHAKAHNLPTPAAIARDLRAALDEGELVSSICERLHVSREYVSQVQARMRREHALHEEQTACQADPESGSRSHG